MTLDLLHTAIPPGSTGLDVWLDAPPDAIHEPHLRDALDRAGASLLGIAPARGSLWPLPVVTCVPGSRLRIVTACDVQHGPDVVAALGAIHAVGDWSIVQRLESR